MTEFYSNSEILLFPHIFVLCCRWEFGGSALDRSKGNKRNWYVWIKMIILLEFLTAYGVRELVLFQDSCLGRWIL